jgi:3-isopropylmalate dehydratase small subunit
MAPLAIKGAGVSAVIAASFARIFFRNAINIGLPIFQSAEAARAIETGDEVAIEPETGIIRNLTRGEQYQAAAFPDFIQDIVRLGGLKPYVEKRLRERRAHPTG